MMRRIHMIEVARAAQREKNRTKERFVLPLVGSLESLIVDSTRVTRTSSANQFSSFFLKKGKKTQVRA